MRPTTGAGRGVHPWRWTERRRQWSDSYLGAAEGELLGAPLACRLAAYSDQRRLFPHQGPLQRTLRTLILGVWLTFTGAYRGRGIRGNNASFGLAGDLGKPLVLDGEPTCLLTGSRWVTGINQARRRTPVLRTWACAQVSAS